MAVRLKDHRSQGIDDRIVESYAVPAALLAVIQGFDDTGAHALMEDMLTGVDREEEKIADEADLMAAILSAHIHTGKETLSVAQLLGMVIENTIHSDMAETNLAKCGIKFDRAGDTKEIPPAMRHTKCLHIGYQAVTKHLLRGTPWEHQSIEQILRRIQGSVHSRRRIGGQRCRCILISKELLEVQFLGKHEEESATPAY